jgi:large subunit ribosomal protein L28
MPRECPFTGKRTQVGRQITRRGKAKYLGGIGRKVTGTTKRTFKANMQRVRAIINGTPTRINVSAKAIRMGMISKPLRREYHKPAEEAKADGLLSVGFGAGSGAGFGQV